MSAVLADAIYNLSMLLIMIGPGVYVVFLVTAIATFKKYVFGPIAISLVIGYLGVLITIKPGGWNFQYAAAPLVIGLWGGITLCFSIAVKYLHDKQNRLGVFAAIIGLVPVLMIAAGLYVRDVKYVNDVKFWNLAAVNNHYKLEKGIYRSHLTREGRRAITHLLYNCDSRMTSEFAVILYELGIDVSACNNLPEDIKQYYREKRMIDYDAGEEKIKKYKLTYGKYGNNEFLVDKIVKLNDEYKQLELIDAIGISRSIFHYKMSFREQIFLSEELIDYEIGRINEWLKEHNSYPESILYLMIQIAVSAKKQQHIEWLYDLTNNHDNDNGETVKHYEGHTRVASDLVQNKYTPDYIYETLLNKLYDRGRLTEYIASSERISAEKLVKFSQNGDRFVRRACVSNPKHPEEDLYDFIGQENYYRFVAKEKDCEIALAALDNIANKATPDVDKIIRYFDGILETHGGGRCYDISPTILEYLVLSGRNDYLYQYISSKDYSIEAKQSLVIKLNSEVKLELLGGEFGSCRLNKTQYILDVLEKDNDSNVAKAAKRSKQQLYMCD